VRKENPGLNLPDNWATTVLKPRMIQIMRYCFLAARGSLDKRPGFFDLLGFDFMIDESMNVWLIEANVNPSLHFHNDSLREPNRRLVEETLDVVIDVFDRRKKRKPISFAEAPTREYELVYESRS